MGKKSTSGTSNSGTTRQTKQEREAHIISLRNAAKQRCLEAFMNTTWAAIDAAYEKALEFFKSDFLAAEVEFNLWKGGLLPKGELLEEDEVSEFCRDVEERLAEFGYEVHMDFQQEGMEYMIFAEIS